MPKNPHISKRQEKKVRKQKIMIAVFGGIFLLLVVIQGPKTLKMMHGGSSSAAPATSTDSSQPSTTTGTSTATGTSTSAVAATAAAPTASASLDDSDPTPARTKSQLVSFDTFDSKDPFVQQVSAEDATASSGSTSPATAGAAPAAVTAAPAQVVNVPAGDTGSSSSPATAAAATRSTASVQSTGRTLSSAVLAVNGQRQSVRLSDSFPKANPTFKLVALSGNLARVGIAGGSYASGAQTVALKLGHTLTLVNTADGMRYELKLVSAR